MMDTLKKDTKAGLAKQKEVSKKDRQREKHASLGENKKYGACKYMNHKKWFFVYLMRARVR